MRLRDLHKYPFVKALISLTVAFKLGSAVDIET